MENDSIMIQDLILWCDNTREIYDQKIELFKGSLGLEKEEFIKNADSYWKAGIKDYEKNCLHGKIEYTQLDIDEFNDDLYRSFERYIYEYHLQEEHEQMQGSSPAVRVLNGCVVKDNLVYLPKYQLDRELYEEVKKIFSLIGGIWKGGKTQAFVFPPEHIHFFEDLKKGNNRNIQKEHQAFYTPESLALYAAEQLKYEQGVHICEPHAGQGSLVKAVSKLYGPKLQIKGYEIQEINRKILSGIPDFIILGEDFLTNSIIFDRIIANPPFSKNQDIDHIYKMWDSLAPGGRIVTFSSRHWEHANSKKEIAFRNWLDEIEAYTEDVEAGKFKESGTIIATKLIIIDKPKESKLAINTVVTNKTYVQPSLFQ